MDILTFKHIHPEAPSVLTLAPNAHTQDRGYQTITGHLTYSCHVSPGLASRTYPQPMYDTWKGASFELPKVQSQL